MDRGAWRATVHRDAEPDTSEATEPTCWFVISFLPRSKHLLISWLQSPSIGILEHKKVKSVITYIFSPSICHGKQVEKEV